MKNFGNRLRLIVVLPSELLIYTPTPFVLRSSHETVTPKSSRR
jgi:hypothetical protein